MKTFLIIFFVLNSIAQANSELASQPQSTSETVKPCTEYRIFRNTPPGTECFAYDKNGNKIGHFRRYRNPETFQYGIEDKLQDGRVWYDKVYAKTLNEKASVTCTDEKLSLPTQKEFQLAESRGFRQVVNDMDKYYWTATTHAAFPTEAHIYDGLLHHVDEYAPKFEKYAFHVRCVNSPKPKPKTKA